MNHTSHQAAREATSVGDVRPIGLGQLFDKLERCDPFLLVMAMDQRRFDTAHIDGSLSFDALEPQLEHLPKDTEIVMYCTDPACVASKLRSKLLVEAGFSNVFRFAGGLAEWTAAGLPVMGRAAQAA